MKVILTCAIVLGLASSLAACGKRTSLEAPGSASSVTPDATASGGQSGNGSGAPSEATRKTPNRPFILDGLL